MASEALQAALRRTLPVLYAYIGWSRFYDGTEPIQGGHAFLKQHPRNNMEARAFVKDGDGLSTCGVGRGFVSTSPLHIVFVARDPADHLRKVVGIYAAATLARYRSWMVATTRHAFLVPLGQRPRVAAWPGGQGMRRWASRGGEPGPVYSALLRQYGRLRNLANVPGLISRSRDAGLGDQTFEDVEALEGEEQKRLVVHRKREARMRRQKILAVLQRGQRLRCEVPGCAFDFERRYGVLGQHYAHVHHKIPLSRAGRHGRRVRLAQLAIVCANCHAMIHRGGACRRLRGLIRPR